MTRINTNVPSMIAQRVLRENNSDVNTSLERLSTGLRINRGKDDPAGLIASQNLRAEKVSLDRAINNAERADQAMNIAEGGLTEVSGLLTELQALVTTTANTSGLSIEEKEANQLQIDSILQTIDRVANSTSFQGTKMLNGNLDYQTSNVGGTVNSFKVNGAKLDFNGVRDVEVVTTASAQVGGFYLSLVSNTSGDRKIDLGAAGDNDGDADESFVIEVTGTEGSRELSFASGTTIDTIAATINSFTDVTGVKATVSGNNTGIRLESVGYGSDEFVSLKVIDDGTIQAADGVWNFSGKDTAVLATATGAPLAAWGAAVLQNGVTDEGQDVEATINGIKATTKGTTAQINTDFLDVEIDLKYDTAATSAARLGTISAMKILGGGADFQLAGRVDIAGKVSIGISNVAVRELGQQNVEEIIEGSPTNQKQTLAFSLADFQSGAGLNVVDGNIAAGQKVVDAAIREVSSLRGRIGAFQQNTIGATIRSLGVSLENTAAAESVIRDVDFASETAQLTRAQILASSAQNTLQQANFQPQNALQLLG